MNTRVWSPINEATREVDETPLETANPTVWEVFVPTFGIGQSGTVHHLLEVARQCQNEGSKHRFWVLTAQLKTLPEEWPENVALAVGPIRTQAEADAAIPALLKVKVSWREVVFAPTEGIDFIGAWGNAWRREGVTAWPIDTVRVRGGAPEHVASLREQCRSAGAKFVEEPEVR